MSGSFRSFQRDPDHGVRKGSAGAGQATIETTIEAAYLRFRPILMPSLAFSLGIVPLVIATGASAKSQRTLARDGDRIRHRLQKKAAKRKIKD